MCQNFSQIQPLLPKLLTILYTAASFKTISIQYHCVANCIKINSYKHFFQYHCLLVYFQHNGRTAHIPTAHIPLALRGPADGLRGVEESHHPHVGSIQYPQDRWYASIIGFLGTKGFKHWQHLEISKDDKLKKTLENVFTAFKNTLEVSTSHWNYINEMYSNIRQGEQETTDQLDQCIKMLVKRCGYTSAEEKM